ncbi:MAG TPA: hypothetical protein ENI15_13095 [Spirochaetes bacterium]|nr:hypothetical protein [Spirochaetota bacterium]
MMSPKNYSEDQIIDVIKKILNTRQDIKTDAVLLAKIIDHTLKNRSVKRTITALQGMPAGPEINDNTADYMLKKIIKLLAVITRVIDNFAPLPQAVVKR